MSISRRYTSADLAGLPDVEGTRYEIIKGELHVSKQPSWEHQYACTEVASSLRSWSHATRLGATMVAPGVIFALDDDAVPDVVWISRERLAALRDEAGHLRGAPELVIEVLSPGPTNERQDREVKLELYSRQGVEEYWIVDWRQRTVQVFRQEQAALRLVAMLGSQDSLTSPLLPGFSCPVSTFWPPAWL